MRACEMSCGHVKFGCNLSLVWELSSLHEVDGSSVSPIAGVGIFLPDVVRRVCIVPASGRERPSLASDLRQEVVDSR